MATTLAALIFRSDQVSDRALSLGFAVALAGFDVAAPRLIVGELPGAAGRSVAFYQSGAFPRGADDDELEHACELFEGELPPALGVLAAAAEEGHPDAVVHAITYADDRVHDDAWRLDRDGFIRHFVHEDEAGVETSDAAEVTELDIDFGEDATEDEERAAQERAVSQHRGSTFLSTELQTPVLAALMSALYSASRRVAVRLVEAGPDAIAAQTRRLNRALRREDGRGAFAPPEAVRGVATPPAYRAFVQSYDWADPSDTADQYRELSLGLIEGTLRFLREDDLRALDRDPAWAKPASEGLYPVAKLTGSALGSSGASLGIVALARDHDRLVLVKPQGAIRLAGPAFGELLAYLALGWTARTDAEEELIEALMLRAKARSSGA